ncbi:Helix-loop-helix DNA-binding domain-containing protein [Aphelenchoides besseyi]|nr:Helix-loop-helix DNA-binding domain-containing protein [Aphelenchoides besseyi]KAI6237241.1 Helix-loop-helix DNA-binding domain-containing protein [Aphelenchoides besseyi]
MSDNDYSDGDLDGDSNGSPAASGSNADDSKKHARAQHNALERRRRDNIKDMYGSLQNEISMNGNERASRAHVLKKTIESIEEQKSENQELSDDLQRIEAENKRLIQEIAEREAALRERTATAFGTPTTSNQN